MISTSQIRDVVVRYLSHGDSDKFVLEFAELSYNIHLNGEPEAVVLSRAIEFKMADLRSNCISMSAFKATLTKLITPEVRVYANSTTSVITAGLEWPVESPTLRPFEDKRFAWV